jgi:DNA repair exonuclease SbcCD ATPase subunit
VQERFEELLRLLDENPEFLEALQDRIVDEKAILRAFQKRAETREAIRRQILHDELLQLPELVRQLVEAQQRNAAQQQENSRLIRQLIESQQRHEAILQEHTRQLQEHSRLLQQLIESQRQHEAILQEHSRLLQQLIESQQRHEAILREHSRQLQEHSRLLQQLIESQRQHEAILQEHSRLLQQLIESQRQHEAILREHSRQLQEHSRLLQQLIESQQQHEAILQEHTRQLQEHSRLLQQLIESQQRHEAILQEHARQLQELTAQVRRVVEVQEQMARDLHDLKEWRKGFDGLRRGAELEKEVRQRARIIFAGGRGGHPESPFVSRLLKNWLRTLNGDDPILEAAADPTAADLIWSKGGKVIVVEVSVKVDRDDVDRAFARANTLRGAGIDAVPVVIGDRWTSDKVRTRAEMRGVEWYVGKTLSEGFIALRRIPDDAEDAEDE